MSKIFSVTGNWEQNGQWAAPEIAFKGEIVIDDEGAVYGYCDEFETSSFNNHQCFIGIYGKGGPKDRSIELYKLSNDPHQAIISYDISDVQAQNGIWLMESGGSQTLIKQGNAKLELKEELYTEEKRASIGSEFKKLRLGALVEGIAFLNPHISDNIVEAIL